MVVFFQLKDGWDIAQKLKLLKRKMQLWRKEVFGSIEARKNCLLADIRIIDVKEEDGLLLEDDRVNRSLLQKDLHKLIFQEEIKWKQRSRIKWLEA